MGKLWVDYSNSRLGWSFLWSIGAAHKLSVINNFYREWMVGIESVDEDLMVQERYAMKDVRMITNLQRFVRSSSNRSCTGETLECWHPTSHNPQPACVNPIAEGKLRGRTFETLLASRRRKSYCGMKIVGEQLWNVDRASCCGIEITKIPVVGRLF